ncbi:DUF1566 domain-containing protein [bacterium AH-315-C08]|nr:DUF1566 domain-containing protein [bacterium AH-315-C08]
MKIVIFAVSLAIVSLLGGLESVRAETVQSQDKRYTDNGDGTISDSKTGLMWMKNDSYLHSGHWLNWYEAKNYVKELNEVGFANYFDWRLPTKEELRSLFESSKTNGSQVGRGMKIHTDPLFGKNGGGSLWSADENGRHNAFGIVFNTGDTFNGNKKSRSRKATRAVRIYTDKH